MGMAGMGPGHDHERLAAATSRPGAASGPGVASAANCQAWTGAQPPSPGTLENALSSVAVLSPCDVWAVGLDLSGGAYQTLIEHWNGSSWAQVDSPDPGSGNNFLKSVRAASASSIWAVGSASDGTSTGIQTLALHWNGTRWAQVVSPNPGTLSELFGVGATSASNAWAVGEVTTGTTEQTLVLHWNGHTWARVTSPNPGGQAHDNT